MKSKKLNKKIGLVLFTLIIAVSIFIAIPTSSFCYDGEEDLAVGEKAEVITDTENEESAEESTTNDGTESKNEDNVFAMLYSYLTEHIGEIFSALAFVASVILMLCYKKGFVPLLKSGIGALSGGVKSLGEETKSIEKHAEALFTEVSERLDYSENVLQKMSELLDTLSQKLGDVEERDLTLKRLECVLTGEVDMMYEIFMAAALPQYLKEKVGEQVAKMHRTIEESEKTNEA